MRFAAIACMLAGCAGNEPLEVPPLLDPPSLAENASVVRVELVQGAPVALMDQGEALPGARPIVAGRPGLLRVYLSDDGRPRADLADVVLTWTTAEGAVTRTVEDVVVVDSDAADLDSTINFELSGDEVQPGVRWSVGVYETRAERARTGDHERPDARFPRPGQADVPLPTSPLQPELDVYVVPFVYTADGSDRRPDVSAERLQTLRDQIYKMYPVRDVRLTLVDEQRTDVEITASEGLGDLLEDLAAWRVAEGLPEGTYAYGLVQPAPSFEAFCSGGCTLGLSYLVRNPSADGLRASVGTAFDGYAEETMVHELGHAHGRRHSPCGNVGNPDDEYPHAGARLGGPGWDVLDGELIDADENRDFMSYCSPRWVSDYQFAALYEQFLAVDGVFRLAPQQPTDQWVIALRPGQAPRLRAVRPTLDSPGEPVPIEVLDPSGAVIGTTIGQRHAFGHGGGATLHVPDEGGAGLRLPGGQILWRESAE